jgi:stearoyl-CoA desaturase (delta-9 desaturase)
LVLVPLIAAYGIATTPLQKKTAIWTFIYYFMTGSAITGGYHRLWSHRSYNATKPLRYYFAMVGAGAFQGSIKWWSRGHRAHHRYTDTELDPYNAQLGFWWSHVGWMILKPRRRPGIADVSDIQADPIVRWQHRFYLPLIFGMAFFFPAAVAGLGWGDWRGGFFYAGALRLLIVHHSTFCVNSLAHWIGENPYDDKHTPKDHWITAFVTVGEGYHNFHHEFPQDFRNAIKFYQYDPTKWLIWVCYQLGLASQLKVFPDNEIKKGQLAMRLKKLQSAAKEIVWPMTSNDLPVLTWDEFEEASKTRKLIVIGGFIHDVEDFVENHPGGPNLIKSRLGKDASAAFSGGVYDHSNGAHNLLSSMRVGCISGGYEVESMKKYSEIIHLLEISGGNGTANKGSDLKALSKKMVPIKGNTGKKASLEPKLVYQPEYDGTKLTGGLKTKP